MSQDKIMIVDNEMEIIQLMRLYLSREGYQVVWTTDSTKAADLAQSENPDLILLDVVMPGISGIDVCGKIREQSDVPIVFVSCKSDDVDKVIGLTIGGDDYITKPFSPTELIARVKAHLRRSNLQRGSAEGLTGEDVVTFGQLEINFSAHTVMLAGNEVHLTATEFDLLSILCKNPNRVFTTQQLFNNLWGTYDEENDVRTVMVHISNVRKKIEPNPEKPAYIKTVRGVGYKFVK
ncbi:MAG: response regulator transcription factor [Lachnospiraceae bacterium]